MCVLSKIICSLILLSNIKINLYKFLNMRKNWFIVVFKMLNYFSLLGLLISDNILRHQKILNGSELFLARLYQVQVELL